MAGARGRRRARDQGADHRPLVPEHGEGARVGPPHRHDHDLSLAPPPSATCATSALVKRTHPLVATLVAVALTGGTASTTTAAPRDLGATLANALLAPGIDPRDAAAIAVDLRTGQTVYSSILDARSSCIGGEASRLVRSAPRARPRHRFRTEVVGAGVRSGRVWRGNLWLVGFGDPTLDRADLDRLARKFAATGIRRIAGRVFGDDTHFDERRDGLGWKSSYLGVESRPIARCPWQAYDQWRPRLGRGCGSRLRRRSRAARDLRDRPVGVEARSFGCARHRVRPLRATVDDRGQLNGGATTSRPRWC